MGQARGYDSLASRSRLRLIEAAFDLLAEEGYRAITARRVADRAGLKPQLVHYYFRSMEELVVAVFERSCDHYAQHHAAALAAQQPLRALWRLNSNLPESRRMTEYMALGKQYPRLREAMRASGEAFRRQQEEAIARLALARGDSDLPLPPAAVAALLSAIARSLVIESEVAVSRGHAELRALVDQLLDRYDSVGPAPDDRPAPGES